MNSVQILHLTTNGHHKMKNILLMRTIRPKSTEEEDDLPQKYIKLHKTQKVTSYITSLLFSNSKLSLTTMGNSNHSSKFIRMRMIINILIDEDVTVKKDEDNQDNYSNTLRHVPNSHKFAS